MNHVDLSGSPLEFPRAGMLPEDNPGCGGGGTGGCDGQSSALGSGCNYNCDSQHADTTPCSMNFNMVN
jgi:hypothetical protein